MSSDASNSNWDSTASDQRLERMIEAAATQAPGFSPAICGSVFLVAYAASTLSPEQPVRQLGFVGALLLGWIIALLAMPQQRKAHARKLKKLVSWEFKRDANVRFHKDGSISPDYYAVVEQGVPNLPTATTIHLWVGKHSQTKVFDGNVVPVQIFLDRETNRPVMVATRDKEAFAVNHGFAAALPSGARVLFSLMFAGVCLLGALGLSAYLGAHTRIPPNATSRQYFELGIQYKASGWTEEARAVLKRAIEVGNGDESAREAQKFLDTRIPRYPASKEAVELNIRAYNLQGMANDEAEKTWKECIQKYPQFEWSYSNLGSLLMEQGRLEEAEPLLLKAVEINPKYLNAWLHLAELRRAQGNKDEARKCIKTAKALDSDDTNVEVFENMLENEVH